MSNQQQTSPILKISGLTKQFPGVLALDNVSMEVEAGQVHALIGENGAGKSTLIKLLAGVYQPNSGSIEFDGGVQSFLSPGDALNAGIKVVFQEIALIPEFTIAENIFMENHPKNKLGLVDWRGIRKKAQALFDRVGFSFNPDTKVSELSISEQQLVEISKALAYDAKLVIMDEPTASLTPSEVEQLFGVIKRLQSLGIAVIYVSHKLEEIIEITDVCTILRDGKWISTKPTKKHDQASLIKDMVGREITDLFPRSPRQQGDVVLSVKNLSTSKLDGISFDAHRGEVLGFFGLMGAGRTELAKAIVGYDPIKSGRIEISGQALKPHTTTKAKALGAGLLSEDRKEEGLMLDADVKRNMSLSALDKFSNFSFIDKGLETRSCDEYVDQFRIKITSLDQITKTLSGGNQQKILIARWLMYGLKVIIVDEPTRGIDVGAKAEIFALIDNLAANGLCVILMTSEMPELLGLSDRICVLSEGKLNAVFAKDETTQEEILDAAI